MNRLSQFAAAAARTLFPALMVSLLFAAPPASAQTADTSQPIVVAETKPVIKLQKFSGTVMHMNRAQITVRGKDNRLAVRTFALSPELAEQMRQIIEDGGFQYGDKVTVLYDAATGIAQTIKGKPTIPAIPTPY